MKTVILGFDALGGEIAACSTAHSADARGEYLRMKAAGEALEGCTVTELWNSQRGFQERFVISPSAKKEISKMKPVKKSILGVLALTLFAFSASAQNAPNYANTVLTNHLALLASTATNLNVVLDCRKQASVGVMISGTNSVPSGIDKNTLYYTRSLDNVTYESTLSAIAWNGNTNIVPQGTLTNLSTFGAGYIKFTYLTNGSGSGTNIGDFNLSYGIKTSAP